MLAREGEKDKEKDEDFEKVKVQFFINFLYYFFFYCLNWLMKNLAEFNTKSYISQLILMSKHKINKLINIGTVHSLLVNKPNFKLLVFRSKGLY